MKETKELEGAWEERGVIGTRIEIQGKELTVLWRNSPVLETVFKTEATEEGLALLPRDREMRYQKGSAPYAVLTKLVYNEGKLTFGENFPITGESVSTLEKTEQSRYGNYAIADGEILPRLEGVWQSERFGHTFAFSGDKMTFRGETVKIHALKNNNYSEIKIADQNPARFGLFEFVNVRLEGDTLFAEIPVCDAPGEILIFTKKQP